MLMSVLKDKDGKISMMRVTSLFTVVSILGVFIAHNIVSMVNGGGFVCMGVQEAGLVGLVLGAKATQAFAEHRKYKT